MTQTSLVRFWNASVYSTDSCLSRSATERQFSVFVTAVHVQNNTVVVMTQVHLHLPQTGCVSQNLVNGRNKLYNKCTTNRSNGVRGLQRSTCCKQPRLVDCRIGVVNKLDRPRRRRRVLLTTTRLTCRGEIFL